MLRQAMISPTLACTRGVFLLPAASITLSSRPAMKSSLTPSRSSPWNMRPVDEPGQRHEPRSPPPRRRRGSSPTGSAPGRRSRWRRSRQAATKAGSRTGCPSPRPSARTTRGQSNLTPGLPMSTMKIGANRLFLSGRPVVRDEGLVGERRGGRHHLGAADDQAVVGLLHHVDAHVGDLVGRLLRSIGGWTSAWFMKKHALLRARCTSGGRCPGTASRSRRWRRGWRGTPPCSRGSGP